MKTVYSWLLVLWLSLVQLTAATEVDWNSPDSVKAAARTTADTLMSFYHGNESGQTPGLLPAPYYWWEMGGMLGSMINYWHTTNDTSYNPTIMQALLFQVGPYNDYMPPNESAQLGNDDQSFWAMAALAAAEYNFPNPPDPKQPSWLALAQAVFNEQIGRWDTTTCNGGLRWQIYFITGYDLKNSVANGALFNIAARLARYTGDDMYAQWASKVWDWMWRIGLINPQYGVFDNSEATKLNCTQLGREQWTYNAGTMLMGASAMYNYTNGDPVWKNRTQGLLDNMAISYFQPQYNGAMTDICEAATVCNNDQLSFKAYLSRWMAAATHMAPFTYDIVQPLLLTSAKAAMAQCTGGPNGKLCGNKWYLNGTWDGSSGVGQQMAALEVVLGTMVENSLPPVTNSTGGTSSGNPTAGYNGSAILPGLPTPATTGGKAGAWIVTAIILLAITLAIIFMSTETLEYRGSRPTLGGKRPRESRIWKGEAMMQGRAPQSEVPMTEPPVAKKRSIIALNALPEEEPRIKSMASTLSQGGGDAVRRGPPDRRSTPVYLGGDLRT